MTSADRQTVSRRSRPPGTHGSLRSPRGLRGHPEQEAPPRGSPPGPLRARRRTAGYALRGGPTRRHRHGQERRHPDRRRGEQFQQRDDAPVAARTCCCRRSGTSPASCRRDPPRRDNDPRRNRGAPIPGQPRLLPGPRAHLPGRETRGRCLGRGGDGTRWLDACGGALTISVGHARPEVVRAAARQLGDVAYVHGGQFTTRGHGRGGCCSGRRHAVRLPGRQGVSHPGRSGGRRDGDEAGPGVRHRHRPSRTEPHRLAIPGLPRQHPGRALGLGTGGAPRALSPAARRNAARSRSLVPALRAGPPLSGVRSRVRRRSRTGAPRRRRRRRRRAAGTRAGRLGGWLRPSRGLPAHGPPNDPGTGPVAHRRRGARRLRAHRALPRLGARGRGGGHRGARQGASPPVSCRGERWSPKRRSWTR